MANNPSFYGNVAGNATSADKMNHTLTIGDKVFDGSTDIEISNIAITNGGTGATTADQARTNLGITPANIGALATTEGAVGTINLAAKAITTEKIEDEAITSDKIGAYAVNSNAIAEKAITASKIGTDVSYSTIGLTSNQVRNIYTGTETPSNTIGNNGDIYIKYAI